MAKRFEFNLCVAIRPCSEEKKGAQERRGSVNRGDAWRRGATPVQEKAWLAFSSVSRTYGTRTYTVRGPLLGPTLDAKKYL